MKKRVLGILLSLMMMLTMMPAMSLTAWADTEDTHTHNGITFEAWDSDNSLPIYGGNYYLTQDVEIDDSYDIGLNSKYEDVVNLCLNGHKIINNSNRGVYRVYEYGALNLYDCSTTAAGCITGGGNDGVYGGAVYVDNGTFTMYGGSISNNKAPHGGGVDVYSGTFNMYGGTISGNSASDEYGGGGVRLFYSEFNMSGGTISDNTACCGGGIELNTSTFNMYGGTITGNTANDNGGGVEVYGGSTFNVSGATVITGNKRGSGDNAADENVFLWDREKISVVGELTDKASIGVSMGNPGEFTNSNPANFNDASKFKSDNEAYVVSKNGTEQLELVNRVNVDSIALNKESADLTVGDTETLTATVKPDNASDKTVTWTSDSTGVATVDENGKITAVSAGTAKITATATNGTKDPSDDKTVTCTVTVKPITYTVTYKVVNGTWSDGSTAEKTEAVAGGSKPANVPTGMKASDGFTGGAWNTNPAETSITEAMTFTYTFDAKKPAPTPAVKAPTVRITASASAGATTVTWSKTSGARSYKVAYRKVGNKKWTTRKTTKTKYVIKGHKTRGLYQYKVAAVTGSGDVWSKVSCLYFKSVQAKAKSGKGKINVSWTKDKSATRYQILVATNKKMNNAKVINVASSKKSCAVSGFKKGRTYYVRVSPVKTSGGVTYKGILSSIAKVKVK